MSVIHAINPTVQEFSKLNCKDKLEVVVNKNHGLSATYDVKMSTMLKKMVIFNSDLDPERMPKFVRKFELHPY